MAQGNGKSKDNELSSEALKNLKAMKTAIAESSVYPMKLEPNMKYKFKFDPAHMKTEYDTFKGKQADYQSAFYDVIEDGDVTETLEKIKLPCNQNVSGKIARIISNGPRWIYVEKKVNDEGKTKYEITPAVD